MNMKSDANVGKEDVLSKEELHPITALTGRLLEEMDKILLGQHDLHRMVLVGIFSRGHILLEGLPGVGKTAMIHALGQLMNLQFSRVQFTPDLMPGDILGTHILQEPGPKGREMQFQPGPVFTNILLADEINRASPKTQSALLEAMQERNVTLLGKTRPLPDPFFVLASQNPIELEGTYPLPEAQLDRFLLKLNVVGANVDVMNRIISTRRRGQPPLPDWSLSSEQLSDIFAAMDRLYLPHAVSRYISRIVAATHPDTPEAPENVRRYVTYGGSPRAAIAIAEAARACALLAGRPTVGFEDAKIVAPAVLNHRILLNYQAKFDKTDTHAVLESLLSELDETGMNLPRDVELAASENES